MILEFEYVLEQKNNSTQNECEHVLLLVPFLATEDEKFTVTKDNRISEISGLAQAIDLKIVAITPLVLKKIKPATFIGKGYVEKISEEIALHEVSLVIIDSEITPIQQRNLEKTWQCKVIDRTGLILEIFRLRAKTKEGTLQVELAHLTYQKSRLVRSWTHLERQKGGSGFLGGPGETQIESDKRQLQQKMLRIKKALDKVVKTRQLHRVKRKKNVHPTIALVGYTNAGKSTLFNLLTKADVMAKDMLFVTLDPTLRRLVLPNREIVILSDTVGFISDLPTHLVAAFRATLEEVIEADLILHIRDFSDLEHNRHAMDVEKILTDLDINIEDTSHIFEIWNKIDCLETPDKEAMKRLAETQHLQTYPLSAKTGEGVENLLKAFEKHFFHDNESLTFIINSDNQNLLQLVTQYGHKIEYSAIDSQSFKIKALFTPLHKRLFYQKADINLIKLAQRR